MPKELTFQWERLHAFTEKRCFICHRQAKFIKTSGKKYLIHRVLCKKHYKKVRREELRTNDCW